MRERMARRMTRRGLLTAMLASFVALPGCKKKGESKGPPEEIEVTLVVRADKNCNEGRPLQVVVRKVSRKSFVEDDYASVARLVVVPDVSVVETLVVFPGQVLLRKLKLGGYKGALGIYGLFNRGKGETWKKLAERPLEIEVVAGESAFGLFDVRGRNDQ